jgi:hypothetical protein
MWRQNQTKSLETGPSFPQVHSALQTSAVCPNKAVVCPHAMHIVSCGMPSVYGMPCVLDAVVWQHRDQSNSMGQLS